jgi:NADH:ubiquinone oxidoreductase subunit 2 (subunit N)
MEKPPLVVPAFPHRRYSRLFCLPYKATRMPALFYNDFFLVLFFANFLLFSIFFIVSYDGSHIFSQPVFIKALGSFAVFSFVAILLSLEISCKTLSHSFFFSAAAKSDLFSLLFKYLIFLGGSFLLLVTKDFLSLREVLRYEYTLFFLFSIFGLLLLVPADNFLLFYLAIELQGLCFYLLATFQRDSEYSVEAGLKYFVLGAFSSGFLLFGFFLLYLSSGTASFEVLAKLSGCAPSDNLVAF